MVYRLSIVLCTKENAKYLLVWMTALCFMLTGCGGGGDSDSPINPDGVTYTGKNTQARIDNENAELLSSDTMDENSRSGAFRSAGSIGSSGKQHSPFLVEVSMSMKSAIDQVYVDADTEGNKRTAVKQEILEIVGENGGGATLNVDLDTETNVVSGSILFEAYRNEDMALDGQGSFSGVYNPDVNDFDSFEISFNKVTGISDTKSFIMNGSVSLTNEVGKSTSRMTMVVKDVLQDKVHKAEDYEVVVSEMSDHLEMSVSGRLYNPDHGYVEIKTTSPFVMNKSDENPSSGEMELIGENGEAGGPTMARLTAISNSQCQVMADTNGDGEFDYDSGSMSWDELSECECDDDNVDDSQHKVVNVGSCFNLSTGNAKEGRCESDDDGDIGFIEGGRVDIYSDGDLYCVLDGDFTDLDQVSSDYSDCNWTYYVEGSPGGDLGLKNKGIIVRDRSLTQHYKMRFIENELPTITFEYENID